MQLEAISTEAENLGEATQDYRILYNIGRYLDIFRTDFSSSYLPEPDNAVVRRINIYVPVKRKFGLPSGRITLFSSAVYGLNGPFANSFTPPEGFHGVDIPWLADEVDAIRKMQAFELLYREFKETYGGCAKIYAEMAFSDSIDPYASMADSLVEELAGIGEKYRDVFRK